MVRRAVPDRLAQLNLRAWRILIQLFDLSYE